MTDILENYLSYDPNTGDLTWINSPAKRVKVGDKVSHVGSDGYISLQFQGTRYKAHRVAWFLHYGIWPEGDLDHINNDRTDNRICNLRTCTRQDNLRNMSKQPNKTSKFKGVSRRKNGLFESYYSFGNKKHSLGLFSSELEAGLAYNYAAETFFGSFAKYNLVFQE